MAAAGLGLMLLAGRAEAQIAPFSTVLRVSTAPRITDGSSNTIRDGTSNTIVTLAQGKRRVDRSYRSFIDRSHESLDSGSGVQFAIRRKSRSPCRRQVAKSHD
jgi:hypothetical protein